MDTKQAKLSKCAEECVEVAKECIKQMHFGGDTVWGGETQKARLRGEIMDMMITVRILQELGEVDPVTQEDLREHYLSKQYKILKYTKISHDAGLIDSMWVPPRDLV